MTRDLVSDDCSVRISASRSTVSLAAAVAALWCLAPGAMTWAHEDNGKSQQVAPLANANLQSGTVTGVNTGQIRINETNYPLDAQVTVSDDEGHPRDLKVVVPEAQILYHVRHGHVDQIVVILPK